MASLTPPKGTGQRYVIQPDANRWAWATLGADGSVAEQGLAASRAKAAGCVIMAIARTLDPGPETVSA